ncbi:hypothetical protein EA742_18375 [Acinetobacter baumannii]|nr:hypothetical protein RU84_08280 [Acinetobacter baumannii]KQD40584.1 hypothetical protein APD15_11680 [Acinetobacter baumannii]KRI30885.1 hypothetical protein APB98_10275 [Acinetobacter baumannii]OOM90224.1 hypothetical protein A4X00_19070 [Acinetobacter baumannii]OOM90520.1 hypothetical protein A4X01_17880 [Acinetobacter baumannii]
MVAERKQVDGLGKTPAHPKVSHSRPTATEGNGVCTYEYPSEGIALMWSYKLGPSKPTGNVGQPANGNLQYLSCQCEIG